MTRLLICAALVTGLTAWGGANAQSASSARAAAPVALATLEPGLWTLKSSDPDAPPRRLCLGDVHVLLNLRHDGLACSLFLIRDDREDTVVHLTCPGHGHARTSVKVETPRLIQLDTQGIADNAPFNWNYEGRWAGKCPVSAHR